MNYRMSADVAHAPHYVSDQRILEIHEAQFEIIAILDGTTSWGEYDAEAAVCTQRHLTERWKADPPTSVTRLCAEVDTTFAKVLSDNSGGSLFDAGFSFTALALMSNSLFLVSAGFYGVVAVQPDRVENLFTPMTLTESLLQSGAIAVEEAENHRYSNIHVGPFVQLNRPTEFNVSGPIPFASEMRVILSQTKLHRTLLTTPPGKWSHLPARQLQGLGQQRNIEVFPVVAVSILASASLDAPCPALNCDMPPTTLA